MQISKKWKRFWTLDRHHAEGFTLVELIVVIAILAILGGIGIPAYSGYVEKANKQADMSLASEVAHALELAYYNQKLPNGGYVVLSQNGATAEGDAAVAMEAAFGTGWDTAGNETMSLKYDGWNGEYDGGSFQGNETALLGEVEGLTEILSGFLKTNADMDVLGGRFGNYMKTGLGFSDEDMEDNGKVADAAVLYVANTTKNMNDTQRENLLKLGENTSAQENPLNLLQGILNDVYCAEYNAETGAQESPQNVFVSTATAYAIMAGYYSYIGQADSMPEVSASDAGSGSSAEMMTMMTNAFGTHFQTNGTDKWKEYLEKQYEKDAMAFMDAMSTADSAKGLIADSLGVAYNAETGVGCFNSQKIKDLFTFYANGEICVIAEVAPDGSLEITMVPEFNG